MPIRKAEATWEGDLLKGKGDFHFTGYDGKFSFQHPHGRDARHQSPEELCSEPLPRQLLLDGGSPSA